MSVRITKSAFEDALVEQFGPVAVLKRKDEIGGISTRPMYLYYIDDDREEDPANAGHCGTWVNGVGTMILSGVGTTLENIANQIGAGIGSEYIDNNEELIDPEGEAWETLPEKMYQWFETNDKTAIANGWPTESQIIDGLVGLGYTI